MLDAANLEDLDQLVDLEQRCFDSDRMSRRSFRRMLTRANAALLVDRDGEHGAVRLAGDLAGFESERLAAPVDLDFVVIEINGHCLSFHSAG